MTAALWVVLQNVELQTTERRRRHRLEVPTIPHPPKTPAANRSSWWDSIFRLSFSSASARSTRQTNACASRGTAQPLAAPKNRLGTLNSSRSEKKLDDRSTLPSPSLGASSTVVLPCCAPNNVRPTSDAAWPLAFHVPSFVLRQHAWPSDVVPKACAASLTCTSCFHRLQRAVPLQHWSSSVHTKADK